MALCKPLVRCPMPKPPKAWTIRQLPAQGPRLQGFTSTVSCKRLAKPVWSWVFWDMNGRAAHRQSRCWRWSCQIPGPWSHTAVSRSHPDSARSSAHEMHVINGCTSITRCKVGIADAKKLDACCRVRVSLHNSPKKEGGRHLRNVLVPRTDEEIVRLHLRIRCSDSSKMLWEDAAKVTQKRAAAGLHLSLR